jgi:hypothetical protein
MRKLILLAGAAALSAAMPALAEKGGKGGGQGGGKGHAAQAQHQGGKAAHAAGGHGRHAVKPDKPNPRSAGAGRAGRAERPLVRERRVDQVRRGERRVLGGEDRRLRADRVRVAPPSGRLVDLRGFRDDDRGFARFEQGCPPGLAKKGNGCLPPGQARKIFAVGQRLEPAWHSGYELPLRYRAFYYDTPDTFYRYDEEGYIYRVDAGSGLISALIPLFGGGFAVGQPLPVGYDVYNVPYQYRDLWSDSDDIWYRYGDDAIYGVDPESGLIESVVALLAGDLNVGQALPIGYDVYNVPLGYRDRYYDTDDYLYRYADGSIYQVDAETQIVQAIVEMLV